MYSDELTVGERMFIAVPVEDITEIWVRIWVK